MANSVKPAKRGTASSFASLVSGSTLIPWQLYYLTDTKALMLALTTNTYVQLNGGRQSIWLPSQCWQSKVTNGAQWVDYDAGSNDMSLGVWAFDTTTQEYIQSFMAMPKGWDGGTISFVPYWTNPGGATTQNVVWSLAGVAARDDDALGGLTMGTAQTSNDTWLAQNDMHIGPESSAITIGGTVASGCGVALEVSRVVASDNMAGDAYFIGAMLFLNITTGNDA